MSGAILLVEDERTLGRAVSLFLQSAGFAVEWVTDAEQALAAFDKQRPDLVLSDVRLPGMSGTELLERLRAVDSAVPIVIMTAHGTIEGAVAAVKQGAFDYLKKPVDLDELKLVADRAIEASRRSEELALLRDRAALTAGAGEVIGRHPAFHAVLERARQLAALPDVPPVLITGETGTGKSLVARTLHAHGARADRPFIDVNCTTLPPSLAEAELFGHERGAFTDARQSRMGLFEAAEGGFLFLDEIGDLDLGIQGKLLKAIEDRVVRRLGGTRERRVDVRIIAATNRDLRAACERQQFRTDLFFRIAVMTLHLPPLRERGDDVVLLAEHALARAAARYGRPVPRLGRGVAERLRTYAWPGNVRELAHVMERAVLWHTGGELTDAQMAAAIGEAPSELAVVIGLAAAPGRNAMMPASAGAPPQEGAAIVPGSGAATTADASSTASTPASTVGVPEASTSPGTGGDATGTVPLDAPTPLSTGEFAIMPPPGTELATWERTLLEAALRESGGNQTRAAQRLGITRDTLRYRLKKYGL